MNVCTFSGRLTRDCEVRTTQSGTTISSFSIAVDGGFGEHKRTDFINCIFKREGLGPHLTKGKPVMVSGELQTEKWTDKSGNERTGFSIICRDIDFQQGDRGQQQAAPQEQYTGRKDMDPF
ncbi:MAG: single-stranded DNA-binding protein [Desulfomicrobium apsheronum]|nr:single-stranded DNA-binding protein [Desulfomicrobium apsheronum]